MLRLIIDRRRTNKLFRPSPRSLLGSIEALGRVRLSKRVKKEAEEILYVSQEDVRDFFYRLGIDESLAHTSRCRRSIWGCWQSFTSRIA